MAEQLIAKIQTEQHWIQEPRRSGRSFERLAHRMVDGAFDHLQRRREQAVWQKPHRCRAAARSTGEAVPRVGRVRTAAYEGFLSDVLPYAIGNTHPRFWGWVMGGGDSGGDDGRDAGRAMNPNAGGFDDAATLVEEQVIRWMAELMGMPRGTSGLLMSGGTMANLIGLTWGDLPRRASTCAERVCGEGTGCESTARPRRIAG